MKYEEWQAKMAAAMRQFDNDHASDDEMSIEEWNDEFMLELYEQTGDRSRV